jgi:hypothetical protein
MSGVGANQNRLNLTPCVGNGVNQSPGPVK